LAQQGYIVACIDGRGTGFKGADFKKVTQNELGKYEVEDQIAAAKQLGTLPYIDASRIGIWGWSYGGFMSSNCLFKGHDVFNMAIAVAPVSSWRFYDTIYTERYMTTPQENASGYDENSPINHVDKLKGDFLLVHGSGDDNVHLQNTMRLAEALIQADKQFDWAIYPDKNHGIYGGNTRLHLYKKMTNFIHETLMRALLVLYMTTQTIGDERGAGLGWTNQEALALYGWYTMLVYVMSIPGGMIADKLIGQKKAVLFGAIILCAGHGVLVFTDLWAFYTGLGLVVLGVGLLKPNISTMVGGLYKEGDIRRDKGFSIFYIGINLGSLLATMIVGAVVAKWGWHAGFGLAGIVMVFGLINYVAGQKYLKEVGNLIATENDKNEVSYGALYSKLFKSPKQLSIVVVLLLLSVYGWYALEWGYGLLFIFLTAIAALLIMIYKELETQTYKDRFLVLLLSFIMVIIFWGAFEQAGGLMNLYTETNTNRMLFGWEVPTVMFQSLNALFISYHRRAMYISSGIVFYHKISSS